jgi:hypothetical protein
MGRLPGGLAPLADRKATPPPYADSRKATSPRVRYVISFSDGNLPVPGKVPERFAAGAVSALGGTTQQDGTGWFALSASRAATAPARELTLIRRIPAGTAPAASAQLAAGVRKIVAPAARAPTIFCWIPPI